MHGQDEDQQIKLRHPWSNTADARHPRSHNNNWGPAVSRNFVWESSISHNTNTKSRVSRNTNKESTVSCNTNTESRVSPQYQFVNDRIALRTYLYQYNVSIPTVVIVPPKHPYLSHNTTFNVESTLAHANAALNPAGPLPTTNTSHSHNTGTLLGGSKCAFSVPTRETSRCTTLPYTVRPLSLTPAAGVPNQRSTTTSARCENRARCSASVSLGVWSIGFVVFTRETRRCVFLTKSQRLSHSLCTCVIQIFTKPTTKGTTFGDGHA